MKCPNCGKEKLVEDKETGEVVCTHCGLVVEESANFAPPPERQPGRESAKLPPPRNHLGTAKPKGKEFHEMVAAYGVRVASIAGRQNDAERRDRDLEAQVEVIAGQLGLPRPTTDEAKRIAKSLRKARNEGGRLTATESAVVGIWRACRKTGFPLTMRRYEQTLRRLGLEKQEEDLYKNLWKASKMLGGAPAPANAKKLIQQIAEALRGMDYARAYVRAVETYALTIANAVEALPANHLLKVYRKAPTHLAAACLCAADDLLGKVVGANTIMKAAGISSSMLETAEALKKVAPQPDRQVVAFSARLGKRRLAALVCNDLVVRKKEGRR